MKTIRCTGCCASLAGGDSRFWEDNFGGHHNIGCPGIFHVPDTFDVWYERFVEAGASDEEAQREADDRATRGESP